MYLGFYIKFLKSIEFYILNIQRNLMHLDLIGI